MQSTKPNKERLRRRLMTAAIISLLMIGWALIDLYGPWSADLRHFDAAEIARLETDMWRAYYDKRKLRLYWLLVTKLRSQNGFPFLRANLNAYRAARAAIVFKDGKNRNDYQQALPYLRNYFSALCKIGHLPSNADRIAELELEWWIVHREQDHYGEEALINAIASSTAELYGLPAEDLHDYAAARAAAMRQRDACALAVGGVKESQWQEIEAKLLTAYRALVDKLNHS
ncbi:MAG: hypothetical protein AB1489_00170 [Acidobacteriota bacterium]